MNNPFFSGGAFDISGYKWSTLMNALPDIALDPNILINCTAIPSSLRSKSPISTTSDINSLTSHNEVFKILLLFFT